MANIKISELNPLLTVEDADVLPIVDNAVTKKVTAAILRTYTQGNSVLLTGAQTVAGIKTFTSQLASSVATGTAPFSVASTTKVTNLNADLLDGLSSAAFQGALTLTTTGSSGASTLNTNTLNVPNYTIGGLGGVPYTGATQDVNLGTHDIYASKYWMYDEPNDNYGSMHFTDGNYHIEDADGHKLLVIEDEFMQIHKTDLIQSNLFTSGLTQTRDHYLPNASGTLALTSDLTAYVPTTRTVSTTSPLTGGGALSSNLTLSIPQSSGSVNGYLSSTDFATFNAKQNAITLTTTGTSGAATLVGSTLNIPNYADTDTGITSLNGLTALTQTFATGTSGTDFGISSATSTHTFNLPTASASNRGALSSADWTTFNNKQNALTNPITGTGTTNYLPKFTGASALGNSLLYEEYSVISIGTTTYEDSLPKLNVSGTIMSSNASITAAPTIASVVLDYHSPSNGGRLMAGSGGNWNKNICINPYGGNTLIGTTTDAGYKLDVNGTARVSGVLTANAALSNTAGVFALTMQGGYTGLRTGVDGSFNVDVYKSGTGYINPFKIGSTGAASFSAGVGISGATAPASGIEFPATQVASASANNLDDYEEGTWTMGIAFGGGSTGVTYSNNSGTYTKIGRQVTVNGVFLLSNKGTSIGSVRITGLPFTIGNTNSNYSSASLWYNNVSIINEQINIGVTNTTTIAIEQISSLGVITGVTDTNFANNSEVVISFTYFV